MNTKTTKSIYIKRQRIFFYQFEKNVALTRYHQCSINKNKNEAFNFVYIFQTNYIHVLKNLKKCTKFALVFEYSGAKPTSNMVLQRALSIFRSMCDILGCYLSFY